jgi:hypothetical protein
LNKQALRPNTSFLPNVQAVPIISKNCKQPKQRATSKGNRKCERRLRLLAAAFCFVVTGALECLSAGRLFTGRVGVSSGACQLALVGYQVFRPIGFTLEKSF